MRVNYLWEHEGTFMFSIELFVLDVSFIFILCFV